MSGERPSGRASGRRLGRDEVFATLSNARRRHALAVLERADGPVAMRELSRRVAALENGCAVEDVTARQRKRAYTALHQTHLPKMDALGIVEYDPDRGSVVLTDAVAELDLSLQVAPGQALTWSERSLLVAGGAVALVAAAWLGLLPVSDLLGDDDLPDAD